MDDSVFKHHTARLRNSNVQDTRSSGSETETSILRYNYNDTREEWRERTQTLVRDVYLLRSSEHKDTVYAVKHAETKNAGLDNSFHKQKALWLSEYRKNLRFLNEYSRRLKQDLVTIRTINKHTNIRTLRMRIEDKRREDKKPIKLPPLCHSNEQRNPTKISVSRAFRSSKHTEKKHKRKSPEQVRLPALW